MKQPTLALVGAGKWGKNLARNFFELGALHTICDPSQTLLDQYSSLYPEVYLTREFEDVLGDKDILAVAIAAPAALHYTLAKQAILAGKDVYVEKPLCLSSQQGEELICLAEDKKRILMVGHLLQYHPYIVHLHEMVKDGEIGKLYYVVSNRLNLGRIRQEENALWSFAPHDLSLILSLCGNVLPTQVRCTGGAYLQKGIADTTLTTLTFENNVQAHVYVSWLHPFKEQKLVVVGSEGLLVFDDTKPWEEKMVLYRQPVTWSKGAIPEVNQQEGEFVVISQGEPLREECSHFLECCKKRSIPKTDGKEGLRVLKVLQAAQASLTEGGEAKCPHAEHTSLGASQNYYAHPTAVIDPGAEIGEGVHIWHFSHIMTGAKLGPRCNIGQNVVISPDVELGANVKVQNNVSVYSGVLCEEDVFLGPSMVFTNVRNPRSSVNRRGEYLKTVVRKGTTIGANATIVCGIELGAHCFIGAGAVVTKNVPPFALMVGNPARQIGWMSRNGHRLDLPVELPAGNSQKARCPETEETYVLIGNHVSLEAAEMVEV